jgi:hypothetical protein
MHDVGEGYRWGDTGRVDNECMVSCDNVGMGKGMMQVKCW